MRLLLPALAAGLALAADDPKRPEWLSGTSAAHPKSAFILGIGEAGGQEKAADKARTEIAKAFSLSLSASTRSTLREASGDFTQEISDDVRTATAKVLDGVEIAEYWTDGKGITYALAVLDRQHSLLILKDKLQELDGELKDASERLPKAEGKFARLNLALKLLEASRSRKKLNADFRVLSPEGKGIPAPDGLNDILAAARQAVSAVSISVAATGEYSQEMARRISRGLSRRGLKVSEAGGSRTPDVVVDAAAEGENLPAENLLWFWAKVTLSSSLSYGSSGEVFKRVEVSSSLADRDPEGALAKTLASAADKSADRIYEAITSGDLLDD